MSSKNSFNQKKKVCCCKFVTSYRSVRSCTLATKTADLFVFIQQPFFFFKNETKAMEAIVCENRRASSLPAAGDVSQGRTSATQRQKFHTDDVKSVRISAMDPTSQEPRSKLFNRENETKAMEAIVCENSRSSLLPAARDVSQGRTGLQLSDRNSILMT